jgi:SulP family sulfate permease
MFRAEYDLDQGRYSESIVAGTTCGELPFFSDTPRTATLYAEKFTVAWVMDETAWLRLQKENPEAAKELLKIALKLTTERMHAITRYVASGVERSTHYPACYADWMDADKGSYVLTSAG